MEKNTKSKIEKLKLTFCGGVGSVTGANFLLTGPLLKNSRNEAESVSQSIADSTAQIQHKDTFSILVDCGLEQGTHDADLNNHKDFLYNPINADVLLITHAHMDHIGRVPKLVRDGFKGVIYSTPETKKLAVVMLADALKLTTQSALRNGVPPLYEEEDVSESFRLWQTIPYHQNHQLSPGYSVYLKDSGHVLGSCMFEVTYTAEGEDKKRKIVFTGDLGNSPTPLLRDTEPITDADYLLMESVYGDKNHEDREHRIEKLCNIIKDNHARNGVLLLPIFSLEKAQEILFEIHKLFDENKLPRTNVYFDSPLAIKLTDIYKTMIADFNQSAQADARKGHHHDIFSFPGLHVIQNAEESKNIFREPGAKIIMAGSGMSNGGRIQHHELNYLGDPNNTIVFIGYQAVGTLGRVIQEGTKDVEIMGTRIHVRARLEKIDGYSSHKDSDHLVTFVEDTATTVKKVFVVMGETKSSLFLAQRLRDYLGVNAVHPEEGETVVLE
ncbi:MAG: MBL fold metallo-hydrolase [Candidatus Pacebacteria bacterium]|nr:MBL fold metallo-hydrolase [Candidatus Paceibacterota bacterium]